MSIILDQYGRPIEQGQLHEEQTARLALLRNQFEGHPSRGLKPPRLASILQRAEQGDLIGQHELFQDMEEKDAHLFSEMQKRRLALQTLDWDIVPPDSASSAEKDLAAYAKDMVGALAEMEDVIFDMTDAVGHGFSALELQWGDVDKQRLPVKATHRPQSWFCLPTTPGADRNELRLRTGLISQGEALWPFGWVIHKHRARSGYLSRAGLFRVLAWPFLFKNYAVRDLAEFLEIYGLPLRLGTYHGAASEGDRATLLRAVVNLGHDAAAIIPEGMKIDFKEAAKGNDVPFNAMIELMERSMSKAILGGTLTSGEGQHGTQALGNVHNEVRHDLKKADARQVASTLTAQLIYPILAVNKGFTDMRRCPRWVYDTQEPEDLKLYADAVPKLVSIGMQIPEEWAHSKLRIPSPKDGQAILRPLASSSPGAPGAASAEVSAPAPQRVQSAAFSEPDELDALAEEMLGGWQDTLGELVTPIQDALKASNSFADFQAALEQQITRIDPAQLADMLARGNFAARVWGMLNNPPTSSAQK